MAVPGVLGIVRRERVSLLHRAVSFAGAFLGRHAGRLARRAGSAPAPPCPKRTPRPPAMLRWRDAQSAPPGQFDTRAVPDAWLTPEQVPGRGEPWDAVFDFALTYDGHAYWDGLSELAARVLTAWTRAQSLPTELGQLRACLFHEQRRWHHFGIDPADRSASYMWALVDAIRDRVEARAGDGTVPTPPLAPASASADGARGSSSGRVELLSATSPQSDEGGSALVYRLHPVAVSPPDGEAWPDDGTVPFRVAGGAVATPVATPVAAFESRRALAVARAHPAVTAVDSSRARGRNAAVIRGTVVPLRPQPATATFTGDDPWYAVWLDAHPAGYVLNVGRGSSGLATLHRVGCAAVTASAPQRGLQTTRVCAGSIEPLDEWLSGELGRTSRPCRRCQPV